MKLFRMLWVILAAMFLGSLPMFAQGAAAGPSIGTQWKPALGGFAMAIASGLCGIGQGKAVASAAEAIASRPCTAFREWPGSGPTIRPTGLPATWRTKDISIIACVRQSKWGCRR